MLQNNIFSQDEVQKNEITGLRLQLQSEQEQLKLLAAENDWLKEQLLELRRGHFGRKSERWETPEQGVLINEAEAFADQSEQTLEDEAQQSDIEVKAHKKKRGHRRPLPDNLEREIVKVELPTEEQIAEDGTRLRVIGWEISEKLKYEPSKTSVIQYHRAKYGVDAGDYVKTAPAIASIIPKGIATPELLSAIAVAKYADGLPLYRIQDIFLRQGIDLTRGTMARWMIEVAKACQPILNILSDRLLSSFYIACDETTLQVLKEKGRKAETKSWMFVRSTPYGEKRVIIFDYTTSRSQEVVGDFFVDYQGFLQCDGLNVYDELGGNENVIRLGCHMHARRKFEQAKVVGAKAGQSLGEKGLLYYQKIYKIEEEIKGLPPDERMQKRLKLQVPIFDEMKAWVDQNIKKVPQKSKIFAAFNYFKNEYLYLMNYLKDGRLEIDNGFTERAIRKFAIGRNNWLFADTEAGANASSTLYSLVVTAKFNGVNPYKALVQLFTELPKAKSIDDYERLADLILSPAT